MSTDLDLTRVLGSWLHEDAHEDADRVLDLVLGQLDATPQRRASWLAWRSPLMSNTVRIAVAAAAVLAVAFIGFQVLGNGNVGGPGPSASQPESPSFEPTTESTAFEPEVDPLSADYRIGRHVVTVDGVTFSFNVLTLGWEPGLGGRLGGRPMGGLSLNKSTPSARNGQAAEAMLYWARFPEGALAHPCDYLADLPVASSMTDLAATVAHAPGTELVAGPSPVVVGGYSAYKVVSIVRGDIGCDPGYYYTWEAVGGGAFWLTTDVGDTIRVWIVDVGATRLFIAGETHPDAGATLEQEIQQIVDSIEFD